MGAIEDTRKILQDFMAPELRGIQVRLDAIDQRFVALEHTMSGDKAELLRTIDFMLRELSLRIELASVKSKVGEAAPTKAASIEHQQ
jgi:predicted nucleotidyltransferase